MTRMGVASEDDVVVTIEDIERLGTSMFDATGRAYYNSGIELETTLRENVAAFSRLRLRPRVLRNVAERRIEVTLLGDQKLSMPVGISPTAFQKMAHPEGEIAVAKAAQAAGTVMTLSSFSNDCLEDVQRGAPEGLRWFQLYVFRDREFTRNLVERAERSGYRALVLTVDMPVEGQKNFDKICGKFRNKLITRKYGNFLGTSRHEDAFPSAAVCDDICDASLTWADVIWLRGITKLPVVAKGICTAEDAEEAIHCGVSAILVSNHGARHLDGLPSTIEVLPDIVRAVRGRVEVYLDGGVRRGTDVVKALALGAKAVFIGRPALWGLAYNGKAGVRQTLEILREELDRALALMGCSSVDQLRPEMVVHQNYFYRLPKTEVLT
ncbi:hydroxyacid oxidase 1-like [Ixodes scapularis]|uniref:hydroxyacid oxidase 1-like n=1 Tax=Ixodes scapularis TaxID=6945 RepID=UPI001A9E9FD8|nr:hydroxyacid oxidase 1-like [Ixodes scapularis]